MKNTNSIWMCAVLLVCRFSGLAVAQEFSTIRDSVYYEAQKEQRILEIILPQNYDPESKEKYEVIYILDGEWNINLLPYIHGFARSEGFVPPAIFVGLPNVYPDGQNQRDRDFLPVNAADDFLSFIEKDVIPTIEKKYPASGERTLFGHSYGGLFVTYAFLTKPEVFSAYLASDPAFQGSDSIDIKIAKEKLGTLICAGKLFWMAGIESTWKQMGIAEMDSIFRAQSPEDLHWNKGLYPNETHNSVRLKGIYDGFRFFYKGYSNGQVAFHPMGGTAIKGKPFPVILFSRNTPVRYTIDGSEPDNTSQKFDSLITVPGPATLKMCSFHARGRNPVTTTGVFKEGKTLPSIKKPKNVTSGGLSYTYYRGEWDKLPDFSALTPVHSGRMDKDFNMLTLPDQTNFGFIMKGFIEIKEAGYYIFALDTDDGGKFYLNDKLIIDTDGLHGMGDVKTCMLPLEPGFYPVRLDYFQRGGGAGLDLLYVKPNTLQPIPIPFEALYSN
ncbi:chitobiase/beta-hexosaminidase C-terminal domain-containing protein [bacterium]|nr:chitobiase/beta-hexosaminidase C-terminal domain-containing protein [bacterium]